MYCPGYSRLFPRLFPGYSQSAGLKTGGGMQSRPTSERLGALGWIRTSTGLLLRRLTLPVGLRARKWWATQDSNLHSPEENSVLQTGAASRIRLMPMEGCPGVEPGNGGFADHPLTVCCCTPYWRKGGESNSYVRRRRFSRPVPYQLGVPSVCQRTGGRGESRTLTH